jgi:hypothetical protein
MYASLCVRGIVYKRDARLIGTFHIVSNRVISQRIREASVNISGMHLSISGMHLSLHQWCISQYLGMHLSIPLIESFHHVIIIIK